MHPYAHEAKASRSSRLKAMTAHARSQEGGMPSAAKNATPLLMPSAADNGEAAMRHGGKVSGAKMHGRLDKRARGGRIKKPSAVVNVMIGKPSGGDTQPMPMPVPMGGAPAPAMAAPPPVPPMGPMGAGMPGMMPRKHGGRIPHTGEAKHATEKMRAKMGNKKGFASGGRVHSFPKMEAGAASGEGRLEKVEKYGKKAR